MQATRGPGKEMSQGGREIENTLKERKHGGKEGLSSCEWCVIRWTKRYDAGRDRAVQGTREEGSAMRAAGRKSLGDCVRGNDE